MASISLNWLFPDSRVERIVTEGAVTTPQQQSLTRVSLLHHIIHLLINSVNSIQTLQSLTKDLDEDLFPVFDH